MNAVHRAGIRAALIAALANVEGLASTDIESAVRAVGGDARYELDSKVAECVIAEVGHSFGTTLVGPADLAPGEYATLEALLDMLQDRILPEEED